MQTAPASPPPGRAMPWLDWAIAVAIACDYAAYGLAHPIEVATPIFDEMYTFPSAREIAAGLPAFEQTHPPLSKLLMGLGYWLYQRLGFAVSPDELTNVGQGARLLAPFAGGASLALLYGLGLAMTGRRLVALLAAALLACDGIFFIMARIAMTNIYGVCFMLLGALATWLAVQRSGPRWLWLGGLGFGLAMASRWTSLVAFSLLVALVLGTLVLRRTSAAGWRRWLLHGVGAFGLLPVAVYLLTYVQPMVAFEGWRWGVLLKQATWAKVVDMQLFMVRYHTEALPLHPGASPWWSWPLLLKPTWYWYNTSDYGYTMTGVLAIGNAFLWWASVPAMAYGWYRGVRQRDAAALFLATMATGLWLAWSVAGANTSFMHYMLEAMPFVCLIVAMALQRAWRSLGNVGPIVVGAYVFLVGWWFWYYQPLLSATPLPVAGYADRLWYGRERWDLMGQMWEYRRTLGLEDDDKFRAYAKHNSPGLESYLESLSLWERPAGLPRVKSNLVKPSPSPSVK